MDLFKENLQASFGISHQDVNVVSGFFEPRTLKKGEFLVKAGQYCDSMAFINDGFLRIYSSANGKEVTQWISEKGYFVTDLSSFIFDNKSRWNIQALEEVSVLVITKKKYHKLRNKISNWDTFEKYFLAHCFLIMEERIHQFISLKAKERYLYFLEFAPELFKHVPQQYLASMLGMSPETFSRIRAEIIS